jgi:hypothetical protein
MDYETGSHNGVKQVNAIDWLLNIENLSAGREMGDRLTSGLAQRRREVQI